MRLALGLVLATVTTAHGQAVVQNDTLVLMNFDGSLQRESTKGSGAVSLNPGDEHHAAARAQADHFRN